MIGDKTTWFVVAMAAWFVQMGVHEGAHAWMATRLGDHLPRSMGRLTMNPFRHIEWNNIWSIVGGVLMPVATTLSWGFPMGMAWVYTSRMDTASDAKIALAGPIGSFLVGGVAIVVCAVLVGLFPEQTAVRALVFQSAVAFMLVSAAYGVFNLIPLPGVDGGTVLYHFMSQSGRDLYDRLAPYSLIIIFVGLNLLSHATNGAISVWRLIEPVFLWMTKMFVALHTAMWG